MEAPIRKMREKLTTEPSRLLNSALSHFSPPIMDRANSHMDLRSGSRQSGAITPMYRSSDLWTFSPQLVQVNLPQVVQEDHPYPIHAGPLTVRSMTTWNRQG